MMQAFRNSAKPIILILSVAFFGWLVFDLSGLTGGGGFMTRTSVGKINGRTVEARTYQEAVQQATQQRQQRSPEPLGVADMAQIRDQVWEQFIQQTILEQEYTRRGLRVSAEEVAEAIRNVPPPEIQEAADFQTDGKFDITKYQAWIRSPVGQGYIPVLEARYRDEILRQKLVRDLVSTVFVSDAALWQQFRDEHETAKIGLVTIDPSAVVRDADVPVSAEEAEAYYREHRKDFERKRTAFLSFVTLNKLPNASDTAAALARAQEIRAEITSGTPFAEVARRESSDTVSGRQGGDLGEWTKGGFDSDFEQAAWSIPLNTVSQPVLTRFGYHVLEITKRTPTKATGRHILVPIELAGSHRDLVDARADSLELLAAEQLDPTALDTASRALGIPIQTSGPIVEGTFAGVQPDAEVWAFQAKRGEQSPVFESRAFQYVFRVDSLWDAGVPPLAAIRGEVEAAVRASKKAAAAGQIAETVARRVEAGTSLGDAAAALNLPYEELGPFSRLTAPVRNPRVRGVAFGLNPGQTSGVIDTKDGQFLLTVVERTPADSSAFNDQLAKLRVQGVQAARQSHVRDYLASLRSSAELKDNRDRLFQTSAQADAGVPARN